MASDPITTGSAIFGLITEDPIAALPVGSSLALQSLLFKPLTADITPPPSWTHFAGTLLKLGFKDAAEFRIIGSAVMVGPAVAVTAKHVIEPELAGLLAGQIAGYALALTPNGLDIWQPHQVTMLDHADLVVMTLRRASALPPDNTLRHVAISTHVPDAGAPVMIAGFRADTPAFTLSPPKFSGEVRAATGVVTAHYPNGRDQFMLPWPCIEVSANTAGGMSGGPAFDAEGRLIGVLSSGMTSTDGGGPSYVSLIHPALDQQFQVPLLNKQTSLRDLAKQMGSILGV